MVKLQAAEACGSLRQRSMCCCAVLWILSRPCHCRRCWTGLFCVLAGSVRYLQAERDALKGILSSSLIASFTGGFGGTKVQASGPTAPMTAVTFNLVEYAVRARAPPLGASCFRDPTERTGCVMRCVVLISCWLWHPGSVRRETCRRTPTRRSGSTWSCYCPG